MSNDWLTWMLAAFAFAGAVSVWALVIRMNDQDREIDALRLLVMSCVRVASLETKFVRDEKGRLVETSVNIPPFWTKPGEFSSSEVKLAVIEEEQRT